MNQLDEQAERVQALKDELKPLLERMCDIMTRAHGAGIIIQFGIGKDALGRTILQNLQFMKEIG